VRLMQDARVLRLGLFALKSPGQRFLQHPFGDGLCGSSPKYSVLRDIRIGWIDGHPQYPSGKLQTACME
jgi:hypothetical protein